MKNLIYLLFPIVLFVSSGYVAQVDVEIPPCIPPKTLSKQEKKDLIKGIKGKKKLPTDLFTEKVVVLILNDKTANIGNVISNKPKEGDYSFSKTIEEVKSACKNAGLNVSKYIIDEMHNDISRESLISTSKPEEDLVMVKKSGAKYYIVVSDDLMAVIVNVENPLEIATVSTEDLGKEGDSNNYKEGEVVNRISKGVNYGGKYELPENIKIDNIYLILYPNLILPKSKPKGLMCKMAYSSFERIKEKNLEQNGLIKKQMKKCKFDYDLVDKESEIKTGINNYILKYYEYSYIKANGEGGRIEAFYLENTITKKVYAFKSGTVSNKYDKYLEKVIKEINEH